MSIGRVLNGIRINVLGKAHEFTVLALSAKGLQTVLLMLYEGFRKLGPITIPNKCVYVLFRNYCEKNDMTSSVTKLGHSIGRLNTFKYLGVI